MLIINLRRMRKEVKVFSDGEEGYLYQVLMSEKELETLMKTWEKTQDPEDALKYMDLWSKEVYGPARKRGVFVDPRPSISRSAMVALGNRKKASQKSYSLSGRWKASKKVYKEGKEYYSSPEHEKETKEIIKNLESYDPSKYYKSESSKKAAIKSNQKEISRFRRDLKSSPKRKALRDSYYTFKSPYWEDRLYSEKKKKKETLKDKLRRLSSLSQQRRQRLSGGGEVDSSFLHNQMFNQNIIDHQQDAWNSHVMGVNAHSIATTGFPIM